MLDPRRTRSAISTRTCGFTTTLATTWPLTRFTETLAVGDAGFGATTSGVVGAGAGVGGAGSAGEGAGGGGGGGVVTVSTCVTGDCPGSVAEMVGAPGCVSEYVVVADEEPAGMVTVADGEKLPAVDDVANVTVSSAPAVCATPAAWS